MNQKLDRRELLTLLGVGGAGIALGCGSTASPTSPGGTTSGTTNSSCVVTPSETAGPFPSHSDIFRSDIREGKSGTTLTLTITVVNTNNGCSPVSGANVEIWQCDAAGNYSEYGSQTAQSYLRGVQTTDANGQVTFTTIYRAGTRAARPTSTSRSRATAQRRKRPRLRFPTRRMPPSMPPASTPPADRIPSRTPPTTSSATA